MKKLLLLVPLVFLPVQAKALTWREFWEPFTNNGPVYYYSPPVYYERPAPTCDRKIEHVEYVPGDYWHSGYTRRWFEWVRVPCDY